MITSKYIWIIVIALGWFAAGCKLFSHEQKPNVLIILTDDQAWGDVGYNGNQVIETPEIDKLSESSVIVNRFYVSPVCATSRLSLLTGKYHINTGSGWVYARNNVLNENEVTISEVFKQNQYNTAYFGKWQNGQQFPHNPIGQGFDRFFGFCAEYLPNYFDAQLEYNGKLVATQGYVPDVLTDSVVSFIQHQEEPFMAMLAYNTPHTPYQVPNEYYIKYVNKGLDTETASIYAMCENIDSNVGRIITALKAKGNLDNTIMIFMSDNGPNFVRFNGGFKGRKGQVDEGGIRVPFLISYPNGHFQNRRIKSEFATHIDVLPTLIELCNLNNSNQSYDGISFAKVLSNTSERLPERLFYSHQQIDAHGQECGAVRTNQYLLTIYPWDTSLYNLARDPFQKSNLVLSEHQQYFELVTKYNEWLTLSKSEMPIPEPIQVGYNQQPFVELSATEAELSGYLQYSDGVGLAHSWVTNWQNKTDEMRWNLKFVDDALYQITAQYACDSADCAKSMVLSIGNNQIEFNFDIAAQAEQVFSPDRKKRTEAYARNWASKNIGTVSIKSGDALLSLKYNEAEPSKINLKGLTISKKVLQ